MKKKANRFYVDGIYHKISVRLVSEKWLARHYNDNMMIGAYEDEDAIIYISKDLSFPKRMHTFFHEISHHILDTLEDIEDEHRCDLLGTYILKLLDNRDMIEQKLKQDLNN